MPVCPLLLRVRKCSKSNTPNPDLLCFRFVLNEITNSSNNRPVSATAEESFQMRRAECKHRVVSLPHFDRSVKTSATTAHQACVNRSPSRTNPVPPPMATASSCSKILKCNRVRPYTATAQAARKITIPRWPCHVPVTRTETPATANSTLADSCPTATRHGIIPNPSPRSTTARLNFSSSSTMRPAPNMCTPGYDKAKTPAHADATVIVKETPPMPNFQIPWDHAPEHKHAPSPAKDCGRKQHQTIETR